MSLIPSLVDLPMGLGAHLDELRRRLMWPVITVAVIFVASFAAQGYTKMAMVWPLHRAVAIVPEDAKTLNLSTAPDARLLRVMELGESATTAATISLYLALGVAAPVILYHLWQFVAVGLTTKERRLAFLFIPAGVICFYVGMFSGYFWGLPYFFAFLISFAASDPTIIMDALRQREYVETFFMWTLAFGAIMDIPWLVVVVVRVGIVTPEQLSKGRKIVVIICLLLAAVITPGSDAASLMALFLPMWLLFESGLFISRFFRPANPLFSLSAPDYDDQGDPQ